MSRDKHMNDQASRKLRGPRQAPGEPMGQHVVAGAGRESKCNCGGCRDGKRLEQPPVVVQL